MSLEKGLHFIKELVTYFELNNYRFEFMAKPVIYNFTLQTYSNTTNEKINNAFVLYRDLLNLSELLSIVKQKNIQLLHLLPEEHFCVFNVVDNKKYVFKLTHDLLLKTIKSAKVKSFEKIFNQLFITKTDVLFNVMDEAINSTEDLENKNETGIILHAKFLTQFLTKNLQKAISSDITFLINLFKLSENLKLSYHKLFIDLNCYDVYEFNSIVNLLIDFDINLQDKDWSTLKQDLDKVIVEFYDGIEYIHYNFKQQSQIRLSIILKNSTLMKWILSFYLFNNIQYV